MKKFVKFEFSIYGQKKEPNGLNIALLMSYQRSVRVQRLWAAEVL